MLEVHGNIWDGLAGNCPYPQHGRSDYPCPCRGVIWYGITTNGSVNKKGECVMGRGVAAQAKEKYPNLSKQLGNIISGGGGNNVTLFCAVETGYDRNLYTFPVKHNWWEPADLDLIRCSAHTLAILASLDTTNLWLLTRPGCHNGRRDWLTEVKPILLAAKLPDNVVIVDLAV